MKRVLAAFVLLLVPVITVATQVQPQVHVKVTPAVVPVGEFAEVQVKVLVPTWFPRPPVFPSFELVNAITRLPPDSSRPTSERVGGETWSGIVRNYRMYPLLGATYRLTGQTITVTYADPQTRQAISADVNLPVIEFRGTVPAGAEDLDPYIAGRSLRLTLDIQGSLDALKAGDALVLEYTAELAGLPAIFLPPLAPALHLDGVSVYAGEPVVEDDTPARRIEKLTLVFNAGGEFDIPEVKLDWWNTETNKIETAAVAGFTISVEGPLAEVSEVETLAERNWMVIAGAVTGLAALLFFLWRWLVLRRQRSQTAAEQQQQSEAYAFDALRKALRTGEPGNIHHALLHWIHRLAPGMDARHFVRDFGDASLQDAVDRLSAVLYADAEVTVDFRGLDARFMAARNHYLRQSSMATLSLLPPLNP